MKTSSQQWWDSVCDYEGVDDELTTDHPGRSEGVEEDGGVDGEQAGGVVGKENPVKEPKLYFQWAVSVFFSKQAEGVKKTLRVRFVQYSGQTLQVQIKLFSLNTD